MTSTRSRDTAPELAVRSAAHRLGLRYRVDVAPLPGSRRRADMIFRRPRVAVYVDGCFWHGCPQHYQAPQRNADYWKAKVEGNRRRDRETDRQLTEAGWTVVRVWEHEDAIDAALRILRVAKTADG